jgi:hypothetical protein
MHRSKGLWLHNDVPLIEADQVEHVLADMMPIVATADDVD